MKGKTILRIAGIGVLALALVALTGFMRAKQSRMVCSRMEVDIKGAYHFLTKEEVQKMVLKGDAEILSQPLTETRLQELEKLVRASPYVKDVAVYAEVSGVLRIAIRQREPLVRIINSQQSHFYIDREGRKMPLSPHYTPKVLVATGNIAERYEPGKDSLENAVAGEIFRLAAFIEKEPFWKAQIGEVHINSAGEMELVPRAGRHRILIGDTSELEQKMQKLLIFYRTAMPRVGWDTYEVINVKYANQIIGERPREASAM